MCIHADKIKRLFPSQKKLKDVFRYRNGRLYKILKNGGDKASGCLHVSGYRRITYMGSILREHRLIYYYHHGELPNEIDHINGIKTDNRVENLRSCSRSENNLNRNFKRKTSDYRGVSWSKEKKKWLSQITIGGNTLYLGRYSCEADAAIAYDEAARIHLGRMASLNFPDKSSGA